MNENLDIQFCEPPEDIQRYNQGKYERYAQFVESAPVDQWVKITGFENARGIDDLRTNLQSSTRANAMKRKQGVSVKTRTNSKALILYVLKQKIEQ